MWPSLLCLKTFSGSSILIKPQLLRTTPGSHLPCTHGQLLGILPVWQVPSHPCERLLGVHLRIYLSRPRLKVISQDTVHPPHATRAPARSHDVANPLRTVLTGAVLLAEPQLIKFLPKEFPPSEEGYNSTNRDHAPALEENRRWITHSP